MNLRAKILPDISNTSVKSKRTLAWQERQLQAQALALCLGRAGEAEKAKQAATGPNPPVQQPVADLKAPQSSVPPLAC